MAREPTEHPVQGAAAGPMSSPRLGGSSSSSWNKCGASAPRPCAPPACRRAAPLRVSAELLASYAVGR